MSDTKFIAGEAQKLRKYADDCEEARRWGGPAIYPRNPVTERNAREMADAMTRLVAEIELLHDDRNNLATSTSPGGLAAPVLERKLKEAGKSSERVHPRRLEEWHEGDGPVTWWVLDSTGATLEQAYIGHPLMENWPGHHTHWTPHPPKPLAAGDASAHDSQAFVAGMGIV